MNAQSAFNNANRGLLGKRLEEVVVEADLIRWAMSFITGRKVKLVLGGIVGNTSRRSGTACGQRIRRPHS